MKKASAVRQRPTSSQSRDVTLSDYAADIRAPTPSAAAELVAAPRAELLARVGGLRSILERDMRQRLEKVRLLLGQFAPENLERNVRIFLQPVAQRADYAAEALIQAFRRVALDCRHRFELASRELASYSPLAILSRGYAVVTHERTRTILLSPQAVNQGDTLSIKLSEGGLRATVEDTHAVEK